MREALFHVLEVTRSGKDRARTFVDRSKSGRRHYGAFYRRKGQLTRASERKGIRSSTAISEAYRGRKILQGVLRYDTPGAEEKTLPAFPRSQGATPHFLIFNRPLLLRASFLDALLSVYPRENSPLPSSIDMYAARFRKKKGLINGIASLDLRYKIRMCIMRVYTSP